MPLRKYSSLIQEIKKHLKSFPDYDLKKYSSLNEKNHPYKVYKILPKKLNPKKPIFLITTGFHGEEPQGPLTISKNLSTIIKEAKSKKVQIVIYPCINPSGFEYNLRYNLSKETPNNYFIYYLLKDGEKASDIPPNYSFKKYIELSKTSLRKLMAKESLALAKDLSNSFSKFQPKATLDIHQDNEIDKKNSTYIIISGPKLEVYKKTLKEISKFCQILKNIPSSPPKIDQPQNDFGIKNSKKIKKELSKIKIDKNGIMYVHDGSITDLLYQKGTKIALAIETDTKMPEKKVQKINMFWITRLIQLISKN